MSGKLTIQHWQAEQERKAASREPKRTYSLAELDYMRMCVRATRMANVQGGRLGQAAIDEYSVQSEIRTLVEAGIEPLAVEQRCLAAWKAWADLSHSPHFVRFEKTLLEHRP